MWKEMRLQLQRMTQNLEEKKTRMMVPPWGTPQATGESLSQLEMHDKLCHKQEKAKENKKVRGMSVWAANVVQSVNLEDFSFDLTVVGSFSGDLAETLAALGAKWMIRMSMIVTVTF